MLQSFHLLFFLFIFSDIPAGDSFSTPAGWRCPVADGRACGFLLLLFIICAGRVDNRLRVMSGTCGLGRDNSRKTCVVCWRVRGGVGLKQAVHVCLKHVRKHGIYEYFVYFFLSFFLSSTNCLSRQSADSEY